MKDWIEIVELGTETEEAFDVRLGNILTAQAAGHGVSFSHRAVRLEARAGDEVAGGVSAKLGRAFMFVELLAVEEAFRGQGIGGRLMARAVEIARAAGARGVWVDTFTFQAPGFYERLGFTEFGRIADYLPGHDRVFYVLRLES